MSRYIFKLGDIVLPYNPESITVKKFNNDDIQTITIEAKGELIESRRDFYYNMLNEYFHRGKNVIVCMPEFGVINAKINQLDFSVTDIPLMIAYNIKLTAECKISERVCRGYTIEEQETLWSFCNRLALDLEEITLLNAGNIKSFVLNVGDKIYLPEKEGHYDLYG